MGGRRAPGYGSGGFALMGHGRSSAWRSGNPTRRLAGGQRRMAEPGQVGAQDSSYETALSSSCRSLAGLITKCPVLRGVFLGVVRLLARGWRSRRDRRDRCVRPPLAWPGRRGQALACPLLLPSGAAVAPVSRPACRAVAAGDAQQPDGHMAGHRQEQPGLLSPLSRSRACQIHAFAGRVAPLPQHRRDHPQPGIRDRHPAQPADLFTCPPPGQPARKDHRPLVGQLDPPLRVRLTGLGADSLTEIGAKACGMCWRPGGTRRWPRGC